MCQEQAHLAKHLHSREIIKLTITKDSSRLAGAVDRCGEQQEENGCFNSLLILVYKTMDPLG